MNTHAAVLIDRAVQMLAAFNDANAAAVAAFYADAALLIAPDGTRIEGRAAIAAHLAGLLASRTLRMAVTPLASEVDGGLGYVTGTYVLWSKHEEIMRGSYIEVWKHVDASWQIAIDLISRAA